MPGARSWLAEATRARTSSCRRRGASGTRRSGIRLTQAIHHGTDHRSQICTGLSALGIEPPEIDVWAFGEHQGRVFDVPTAP